MSPPQPLEPRTLIGLMAAQVPDHGLPVVAGITREPPTLHLLDCSSVDHPYDRLVGFDAPIEWQAIGALAGGTHRHGGPVLFGASVTRDSRCGAALVGADGAVVACDDPEGLLVDVLARSLGRPTAPPPPSTVELLRTVWLDRVMARAVSAAPSPGWSEVVRLHPAWEPGIRTRSGALLEAEVAAASRLGWSQMRDHAIAGRLSDMVRPAHARWMDDGIFARVLLAHWPDLPVLRGELGDLLAPNAVARLDRVLDTSDTVAA